MLFMSGPRQAGKTTLAKSIAKTTGGGVYFNYDMPEHKVRLAGNPLFFEETDRRQGTAPLVILDEIHKFKDWKNYLKGLYDGHAGQFRFLVTGSGRLDLLISGGDSLAGRFLRFRVFPFTIGELCTNTPRAGGFDDLLGDTSDRAGVDEILDQLLKCSGFPEPFLKGSETSYRRWAGSYHRQVVRDDVRDVMAIRDLSGLETLYALMAERVASPFSINSIAAAVKASHKTIASWLDVFERLFLMFRIKPYSRQVKRSLLKEPKFYFFDFCRVGNQGARLENLVAVELFRAVLGWTDYGLGEFDLFYLRTRDGIETDFLITRNSEPFFMVEVKTSDTAVSSALRSMQNILRIPAIQLVRRPGTNRHITNGDLHIRVVNAADWLAALR